MNKNICKVVDFLGLIYLNSKTCQQDTFDFWTQGMIKPPHEVQVILSHPVVLDVGLIYPFQSPVSALVACVT